MSKRSRAIADDILRRGKMNEILERQFARERRQLIKSLDHIAEHLEDVGEHRMGLVNRRMALRYHTTVARLRAIVTDLDKGDGWS